MVLLAQDGQTPLHTPLLLVCVEPTTSLGNAAEIVGHLTVGLDLSVGKSGEVVDILVGTDLWDF